MRGIIAIICVCFVIVGNAQQLPQYSQYMRNQIVTNPAASGIYDFMDLAIGGRFQWAGLEGAPKTAFLYGSTVLNTTRTKFNPGLRTSQGPVRNPKVGTGRIKHALGGQVVADEFGAFRRVSAGAIYSIHLPVSQTQNISFGTKLGLSNNTFLEDRATVLTSMVGYTGPLMTDPTYDAFIANQSSKSFMDLGFGVYFYSNDMFIGVSADQLTRDFVSFGSGTANFDPNIHFQATAGYKFSVSQNLTLMPNMLVKYLSPAPISVEGGFQLEYKEWMWAGLSYRHTDAIIGMIGCNLNEKFKLGYSFDFSLSEFNNYTAGGHELVLGLMLGR